MSKAASIGIAIVVIVVVGIFFFGKVFYSLFQQSNVPPVVDVQGTEENGSTTNPLMSGGNSAPAETTNPNSTNTNTNPKPTTMDNTYTTADGLIIKDEVIGTGAEAKAGQTVSVNYLGTFKTTGEKFDSSYDRNQAFSFTLGAGQVIQGWDEGVAGMRVGGKRMLTIPSSLAYGPNDYGPIPGGSTLVFQVELLGVK